MSPPDSLVGAVEAGGTKFVCAVGTGPGARLMERTQFSTGDDPAGLMRRVVEWFAAQEKMHGALAGLGVASFGPVDLDERSPTYGFITTTPKRGWQNADILGPLRRAFSGRPIGFDTDVNGAAPGEARWGAAQGLEDFASGPCSFHVCVARRWTSPPSAWPPSFDTIISAHPLHPERSAERQGNPPSEMICWPR